MERERLGSRLGFILLSAGCAIGCGNVWKFPWMCGRYGGGGFVLIYIICLILLGLPVMTMEFAAGRAAQASILTMYRKLERPGQKWHIHGTIGFIGNICLMAFYTVVTGWIMYYFVSFISGGGKELGFASILSDPVLNVKYLAVTVFLGYLILCFGLQRGLERVTKYIMSALIVLMVVLAIHSMTLPGAKEGLSFYLIPDFSKIDGSVAVGAMNQAFFTLSVGMGSMAIFGSYIGRERSLMGESMNVILLDTFVAITAGLIMFPACFTYGLEVSAGPSLLFDTMANVFNNMPGGRWWGALFFLFMIFAAFSTVLAVFETILSSVREKTGWNRPKGCLACAAAVFLFALTTALGFNKWSGFVPFAQGTSWLDLWDFIVSTNILPLGSLTFAIFCCYRFGWGWDNFTAEANAGKGLKVRAWMRPFFGVVAPAAIIVIYIYGMINFKWK